MIESMVRTIVFIGMTISAFASETLDALVNASASFSTAIQEQLAAVQGDLSPTVFTKPNHFKFQRSSLTSDPKRPKDFLNSSRCRFATRTREWRTTRRSANSSTVSFKVRHPVQLCDLCNESGAVFRLRLWSRQTALQARAHHIMESVRAAILVSWRRPNSPR